MLFCRKSIKKPIFFIPVKYIFQNGIFDIASNVNLMLWSINQLCFFICLLGKYSLVDGLSGKTLSLFSRWLGGKGFEILVAKNNKGKRGSKFFFFSLSLSLSLCLSLSLSVSLCLSLSLSVSVSLCLCLSMSLCLSLSLSLSLSVSLCLPLSLSLCLSLSLSLSLSLFKSYSKLPMYALDERFVVVDVADLKAVEN